MRHFGSVSQVNIERNQQIAVLYREAKRSAEWPTSTMRLCEMMVDMPVPKYYISEESAAYVIGKRFYRGVHTTFRNPYKQRLYDSLYELVVQMKQQSRFREASLLAVVTAALQQPAPCVGLTPISIYECIPKRKYPPRKSKKKKE